MGGGKEKQPIDIGFARFRRKARRIAEQRDAASKLGDKERAKRFDKEIRDLNRKFYKGTLKDDSEGSDRGKGE